MTQDTVPVAEAVRGRRWLGNFAPRRILAIRIQAMGDTVATFPYLGALRRALPDTELDFLTRVDYADLPNSVTLADRVFLLRGMTRRAQGFSALSLLPRLWARRYDVVLDLQRNSASRLVRRLLSPVAWSEFDRFSPQLAGERIRRTIEAVGWGPLDVVPGLALRDPELGLDLLGRGGWTPGSDLVVLNPAGLTGDRHWPISRYIEFAARFASSHPRPVAFVVLGLAKVISKSAALHGAPGIRVIDLVGRTSLAEAMAIVSRASLVVSEDAGLMHVAWVAGVPTVGLFGASRWIWARPHGNYCQVVVACREGDGACMGGRCRQGPPPCLEALTPERVHRAAIMALRPPPGGKAISCGGVPCFPHDGGIDQV